MRCTMPPPIPPKPKHLCNLAKPPYCTGGSLRITRPAPPPPLKAKHFSSGNFACDAEQSTGLSTLSRRPSAPCSFFDHVQANGQQAEGSSVSDDNSAAHPRLLPGHESFLSEMSSGVYSDSDSSASDDFETTELESDNLYRVAEEMCKTEWAYVDTLKALSVDFQAYMEEQARAGHRVVTQPDVAMELSRQLDALRRLHLEIAEQLQGRLERWTERRQVTDILLKVGHFLKMSRMFLQQKTDLVALITNVCRQYPEFAAAVKSFEDSRFNGLQLVHQLDCVHQRICRYPLLLSSYMKYLPNDYAEYPMAVEAKALLQNVALEIENGLLEGDNMRRMYEIQRRLQSNYEIIRPGRKLIKEGEILKHSRKEIQTRYLLLFNDVLLYCAPVVSGSSVLKIRNELPLKTLDQPVLPTNDANGIEFHLRSQRRSVILLTKSTRERDLWVEAIRLAIGRNKHDSVVSMSSDSLASSAQDVGRKAPPWVPDDRVTMCQHCSSQFTTIRRRHHCRGCGKVICRRCIGKAPVEYADHTVQIVCPDCFEILINRLVAEEEGRSSGSNNNSDSSKLALFLRPRGKSFDQYTLQRQTASIPFQGRTEEDLIKQGHVWLQNRRSWKKYWCLLRKDAVMELYAASEDTLPKMKVVLLSYEVQKVMGVNGEADVLEVTHKNQVVTSGSQMLRLVLKAGSNELTDSWHQAIQRALLEFEEC